MTQTSPSASSNKLLIKLIAAYKTPSVGNSIWQIINTVIPYIVLWILMVFALRVSFWLALPLMVLAAGFTIRMFIIFHDCGHGAFFKSKVVGDILGIILGVLTLTPYYRWHHAHLIHHRTSGNLDKRGTGDVWTMTVEEFNAAKPGRRLFYKIYRNPFVMFGIGAPLIFLITNRFTFKGFTWRDRFSVYFTNVGIAAVAAGIIALTDVKTYLILQVGVTYMASAAGVFLFYVQHQFPDVHWYRDDDWDYSTVAINGASYLKLPAVLQWFSGNIGFHHIHHLSSKIPNYKLEKCYNENQAFREIKAVTLREAFSTLKLRLWDEASNKLITYRELSKLARS